MGSPDERGAASDGRRSRLEPGSGRAVGRGRAAAVAASHPVGSAGRRRSCFDRGTFNDVRDRALLKVFLATGLRFRSVVEEMTVSGFDRVTGEFAVAVKGGRVQLCKLSPGALKDVRRYLAVRREVATDRLWVTDRGEPLTYWGAQSVFRRIKHRSGVKRLHAHLCRHTVAQNALLKGAGRAEVQDILGHQTDAMARRYAGRVRQVVAAQNMARYAVV